VQVGLEAAAAAIIPKINLAEVAPRPQSPLQPCATPAPAGGSSGHFLAFNMVGCVISRNLGDHNSIEVRAALLAGPPAAGRLQDTARGRFLAPARLCQACTCSLRRCTTMAPRVARAARPRAAPHAPRPLAL
jgi:hypothetical protein